MAFSAAKKYGIFGVIVLAAVVTGFALFFGGKASPEVVDAAQIQLYHAPG